ncbi:hypothetical protein MO973_42040 [Paenibacillus sp. TRM 82003]|uniref:hypothetical protein n=1 Tax=Kineococcus sp. TRM81007 TaxID=2925831 RepID=UPI001F5ACCEE|nr:hypothetical protein [Kineococcus sp. TRM81007]MCI2239663.1 hypothetical protein [Kineococcus sp. TRM81007]MCI3926773.1 hypothetical protein [Paenibacillus sp. TRM 82003]
MRETGEGPAGPGARDGVEVPVLIDCDSCTVRPAACSECVVPVLLGEPGPPRHAPEERDPVQVAARSGPVPPLRLRAGDRRAG